MSRIGIRATRELGALCGELRFRVVISDRPAPSVLMLVRQSHRLRCVRRPVAAGVGRVFRCPLSLGMPRRPGNDRAGSVYVGT